MSRPKDNDYISLRKAADMVYEITGVRRCVSTVFKWGRFGRRNNTGGFINLKTRKRLGRSYTTREWLEEFIRGVG